MSEIESNMFVIYEHIAKFNEETDFKEIQLSMVQIDKIFSDHFTSVGYENKKFKKYRIRRVYDNNSKEFKESSLYDIKKIIKENNDRINK